MQISTALAPGSQCTDSLSQNPLSPCFTPPPEPQGSTLGTQVGSSCYCGVADDALKDEDNAGWVLDLAPDIQAAWLQRIRWLRLVDRLAEQALIQADPTRFTQFLAGWQQLKIQGTPPPAHPDRPLLEELRQAWFGQHGQRFDAPAIAAWERYLTTIHRYHQPGLVFTTLAEYETFLVDMGGGFFQVFPFVAAHQRAAIAYWGRLDQIYNQLRDLQEDLQQGLCYFPTQVLAQFGLHREALLDPAQRTAAPYQHLMQFWVDKYLPRLRRKARQIARHTDLHPSWAIFLEWSIARYRRIETTLRECAFDYERFTAVYWPRVQAELPQLRSQVQTLSPQTTATWPVVLHAPTISRMTTNA